MKWKIFYVNLFNEFVAWNGEFVEAETFNEAIILSNMVFKQQKTYINAVPENWELPLQFKYTQRTFNGF
jgi:hypothetical protein